MEQKYIWRKKLSKVILSDKKGIRQIIIFDSQNENDVINVIERKILNDHNSEIIVKQWIIDEYWDSLLDQLTDDIMSVKLPDLNNPLKYDNRR